VQDLSFEENRAQPIPSVPAQVMTRLETSPLLLKYLSLLIGLVVVLAFGVRPALRKAVSELKGVPRELSQGGTTAHQAALPLSDSSLPVPDRIRAHEIFEQVATQMKNEPAQSSRLLQSWIHSE
jgi:flagellar M-ring protein FliF